jgi:hypothetical protein
MYFLPDPVQTNLSRRSGWLADTRSSCVLCTQVDARDRVALTPMQLAGQEMNTAVNLSRGDGAAAQAAILGAPATTCHGGVPHEPKPDGVRVPHKGGVRDMHFLIAVVHRALCIVHCAILTHVVRWGDAHPTLRPTTHDSRNEKRTLVRWTSVAGPAVCWPCCVQGRKLPRLDSLQTTRGLPESCTSSNAHEEHSVKVTQI